MHPHFLIGGLTPSRELRQALETALDAQVYYVQLSEEATDFLEWIRLNRHQVDCLVFELSTHLPDVLETLKIREILLPMLIIVLSTAASTELDRIGDGPETTNCQELAEQYHQEAICIDQADLSQLEDHLKQAINQFLQLSHRTETEAAELPAIEDTRHFLLSLQQQRLAEKLKERLGYLGVFYKRNPDNFIRNLTPAARDSLIEQLRTDYRAIVLSYFSQGSSLNSKIDDFVNAAFFADVSVSKIVELHMELMDKFAKQLKLEGRSEEILLDYRLTLIDVIAHLCEMYRRSIPREV